METHNNIQYETEIGDYTPGTTFFIPTWGIWKVRDVVEEAERYFFYAEPEYCEREVAGDKSQIEISKHSLYQHPIIDSSVDFDSLDFSEIEEKSREYKPETSPWGNSL